MFVPVALVPSQPTRLERGGRLWIGNARPRIWRREGREVSKLVTPAVRDQTAKAGFQIGEELERCARGPFLAHEQQWRHRHHQQKDTYRVPRGSIDLMMQPVA